MQHPFPVTHPEVKTVQTIETLISKLSKMSNFQDLPDELILEILSYSEINILIKCGQVSRRIRKISHDDSLWATASLEKKIVKTELLEMILAKGCKILKLRLNGELSNSWRKRAEWSVELRNERSGEEFLQRNQGIIVNWNYKNNLLISSIYYRIHCYPDRIVISDLGLHWSYNPTQYELDFMSTVLNVIRELIQTDPRSLVYLCLANVIRELIQNDPRSLVYLCLALWSRSMIDRCTWKGVSSKIHCSMHPVYLFVYSSNSLCSRYSQCMPGVLTRIQVEIN